MADLEEHRRMAAEHRVHLHAAFQIERDIVIEAKLHGRAHGGGGNQR